MAITSELCQINGGCMGCCGHDFTSKESIKKGDLFTEDNVTTKRPALGISPMKWKEILGTKASKDYHLDDLIE